MKKRTLFSVAASVILSLSGTVAMAATQAQLDAMKRCVDQESTKSDDTRGGLSAVTFCAAVVVSGG